MSESLSLIDVRKKAMRLLREYVGRSGFWLDVRDLELRRDLSDECPVEDLSTVLSDLIHQVFPWRPERVSASCLDLAVLHLIPIGIRLLDQLNCSILEFPARAAEEAMEAVEGWRDEVPGLVERQEDLNSKTIAEVVRHVRVTMQRRNRKGEFFLSRKGVYSNPCGHTPVIPLSEIAIRLLSSEWWSRTERTKDEIERELYRARHALHAINSRWAQLARSSHNSAMLLGEGKPIPGVPHYLRLEVLPGRQASAAICLVRPFRDFAIHWQRGIAYIPPGLIVQRVSSSTRRVDLSIENCRIRRPAGVIGTFVHPYTGELKRGTGFEQLDHREKDWMRHPTPGVLERFSVDSSTTRPRSNDICLDGFERLQEAAAQRISGDNTFRARDVLGELSGLQSAFIRGLTRGMIDNSQQPRKSNLPFMFTTLDDVPDGMRKRVYGQPAPPRRKSESNDRNDPLFLSRRLSQLRRQHPDSSLHELIEMASAE